MVPRGGGGRGVKLLVRGEGQGEGCPAAGQCAHLGVCVEGGGRGKITEHPR